MTFMISIGKREVSLKKSKYKIKMKKLLQPKSVAIVGASATEGKVGNTLVTNLIEHGYEGEVFYINPKTPEIAGKKTFATIADIGKKVDMAIIAIPGKFVLDVVKDGKDYCKNYIVISAGFGESSIDGHNLEMKLLAFAEEYDLTILGPNCLGLLTPADKLNASFAPGMPAQGPVAFISQSGALAVALVDRAEDFGIGFSSVVSIGNKMQVDSAKLIDYFCDDPSTTVIALYLEGIKDGDAFMQAAQRAYAAGKHIILLKSGRSTQAQDAIALHTGSLAGDDLIVDVVCKKMGITRVNSVAELFGAVRAAMRIRRKSFENIKSSRVAIVTNAGGPGVIATDSISRSEHMELAQLDDQSMADLAAKLPEAASVHNPIDLLGDADAQRYKAGIEACLASDKVDVVFVLLTPQKQTPVDAVAEMVLAAHNKSSKTIIASFIGGASVEQARKNLPQAGVLYFDAPDAAIQAVNILSREQLIEAETIERDESRQGSAKELVGQVVAAKRQATYFSEARELARMYGIPVSSFVDVTEGLSVHEGEAFYPCVAKVDNPEILHKSDRGGVILPINSGAVLSEARERLLQDFPEPGSRIIAQPLTEIQTELIIGLKRDATFGAAVVVGIGGIYTEIFKKSQIFIPPFSARQIAQELDRGDLGFLFTGARGQKAYDSHAVAKIVLSIAQIAQEVEEVAAIDINPLLIYDDREPLAVDVKFVVREI